MCNKTKDAKKKNLLIIGNGFDLNCGLNTRFAQFFDNYDTECDSSSVKNAKNIIKFLFKKLFEKKSDYKSFNDGQGYQFPSWGPTFDLFIKHDNQTELPCSNGVNFFLLYFMLLKECNDKDISKNNLYNWSDIENQLYVLLARYSHIIINAIKFINNNYGNDGLSDLVMGEIDSYVQVHNSKLNIIKINLIVMSSCAFLSLVNFDFARGHLYHFLYDQLSMFETDFGSYINEEECTNQEYMSNVEDIIKYIKKYNGNNQNIISFNYTDLTKFPGCTPIRNVHATFSYHPIIGIDSSRGSAFKEPYYMFTKTYRILRLINNKNEGINSNEYFRNILPRRENLDKLIFYGHSLGIEDYSYFMAIFDYYRIYDSNVKLIFYFNYHNGATDDQIKQNQYVQIFKLINHYGASIRHGENLLHKLILENRIHIEYMPKGIGKSND